MAHDKGTPAEHAGDEARVIAEIVATHPGFSEAHREQLAKIFGEGIQ